MSELMPTVMVTGGAGALGGGAARALLSRGWRVIVADIDGDFARPELASWQVGERAILELLDVTDRAAVTAAIDGIVARFGTLDALVNCAGGSLYLRVPKADFVASDPAHWDRTIAVNLFGTLNCCHAAALHMKRARHGSIVNTASGAGLRGGPPSNRQTGAAVYSATKAGIVALTQALAQELGPHGIRVNAVAPGRNESRGKTQDDLAAMQQAEEAREPGSGRASPLLRFGTPADIGNAIAFLLSAEAGYLTGTCLDLTGGIALH
jgi:2-hydroxycyclohexanecarboxyl-CoA dehydrogenase